MGVLFTYASVFSIVRRAKVQRGGVRSGRGHGQLPSAVLLLFLAFGIFLVFFF